MDKPNQQRNTKTQKPQMKLQVSLPPNRKARRRDAKRNRRVDYQGHGYGTSNANKGARGKSKYLKAKMPYIKQMAEEREKVQKKIKQFEGEDLICKQTKQSKSVKPVLKEEVYGGRKTGKRFAADVPNLSNTPKNLK